MARISSSYKRSSAYCVGLSTLTGTFVQDRIRSRTVVSKRTKPVGLELRFSPTAFSNAYGSGQDVPHLRYVQISCSGKPVVLPEFVSYYDSVGYGYPTQTLPFDPSTAKIMQKIKSQGVSLGMIAAEYRETQRMFSQQAKLFGDGIDAVKRGNFRNIPKWVKRSLRITSVRKLNRLLDAPFDTWMMYRYGMTPLINDIFNLVSVVKGLEELPLLRRVSVKQSVFDTVLEQRTYKVLHDLVYTERKAVVRDVVHLQYSNPTLASLASLGLLNPFHLAWEVIPCSFVLGCFVSLGDFLASLDALAGVSRYSYTRTIVHTLAMHWPEAPTGKYHSSVRSVRPLTVPPPLWEPSTTWKRFVDSTALLRMVAQRKLFKV